MKYHIEYAKYKYGYVTITGWLIGDTAETDTGLQVLDEKGVPMAAEITRTVREDIREAFFPGQEEKQYGFRIRLNCEADETPVLVLQAGSQKAKCKIEPRTIRRTGIMPDSWKQQFKQKLKQVIGKNHSSLERAADGAVIVPAGMENPYRDAWELETQETAETAASSDAVPKFSILVPLYQTNREHLLDLLESVQRQSYRSWELCLADGSPESILTDCERKGAEPGHQIEKRIAEILRGPQTKYRHLEQNLGISGNTNAALELVTGEYVVMADHDDRISLDALLIAAEWLQRKPETDFLYSDSDLTDHDHLYNYNPLYKPGWSPEMLYSANYITHLSIVRTSLLRKLGGFRPEYDGAQDWDLFLRIGEETKQIQRIPEVLYHWRAAAGSTALAVEEKPYARIAQLKAVQDHLDRTGIPGRAEFADRQGTCIRVRFASSQGKSDSDRVSGPVCIVTAPGIELSREEEDELCAWAGRPGIGIVGVRVLDREGRICSQGRLLQTRERSVTFYAGKVPGTADALGHTDWYRNDLVPHTACYAVPAAVAEIIGMPDADGGEAAMTEWFRKMRRAGYRSLITPFVEVFVEVS